MEWNLLWNTPGPAPDPHVVATRLWAYFISTLNLNTSQTSETTP
jgi:hypothetical protein